jgi:predicted nuclease of restriction endonuclease-like (RecB) superfamily
MREMLIADYHRLLTEIKDRVRSAQYEALRAVNKELIALYWDIGRLIVQRQKGNTWGKSVVERLAKDLRIEFPGISGFSAQNLWRMRQFYGTYAVQPKLSPLVREISWSKNVIIMMLCKNDLQREFYIRMTRKFGWTKNVPLHHIDNKTYEKTLLNQTNFDKTVPETIRRQAKLAIKDEYTFNLLELGEEHSELELQRAILARIETFLREMGGMFAFLGSQYRLEVDGQEYFIDLLLYHRGLKSLVDVELKIGDFIPEFVGKMQFYLTVLDRHVRTPDENPSIGIILCKGKRKTIVEYALWESNKPIGVATYKISRHIPKFFKGQLPEPAQIARLLEDM